MLFVCQVLMILYILFTTAKIIEYIVDPTDFYAKPYDSLRYFVKVCVLGYIGWAVGLVVPVLLLAFINLFIKEQLQNRCKNDD